MELPPCLRPSRDGVILDVFVQPRAARDAIGGLYGSALKVKVKAPPAEGRANAAVADLVAGWLDVPKKNVSVVSGGSSRNKAVAVTGVTLSEVRI
ncbi:MAG TPA: DUF167 domain-containing protein, partial [Actinomycetota bacterium]|nr:DUF167 domain-containing protein [Actinomycetota bacterium]